MLKKFAFSVGLWYNKSYCAVLAVTFYMSLSAGSGKDIITLDKAFRKGILQGIPIALGYLSVSFGFGIMAVRAGLSVSAAVAISITNVTSAGQAAGVGVIAAGGSYLEMALTFPCPRSWTKRSGSPNAWRRHSASPTKFLP